MSKQLDYAQVHRFRDDVAAWLGDGSQQYMTPAQALQLGTALIQCATDVLQRDFQRSTFGTFRLEVEDNEKSTA
jgi:hypothetical protein